MARGSKWEKKRTDTHTKRARMCNTVEYHGNSSRARPIIPSTLNDNFLSIARVDFQKRRYLSPRYFRLHKSMYPERWSLSLSPSLSRALEITRVSGFLRDSRLSRVYHRRRRRSSPALITIGRAPPEQLSQLPFNTISHNVYIRSRLSMHDVNCKTRYLAALTFIRDWCFIQTTPLRIESCFVLVVVRNFVFAFNICDVGLSLANDAVFPSLCG